MTIPAPFAYGPSGRWLTSTHEHEVFICDGDEEHTVHVLALDAAVVGVRNTPSLVLALDADGTLYGLDPMTGARAWTHSVGPGATALAGTETGRWAAVHAGGVAWGDGSQARGNHDVPGARFAAFDPSGQVLAIVTADGELMAGPVENPSGKRVALGFGSTGLCHSRLGYWLASTTRGVFRIPVDSMEPELYLKWGGDAPPTAVACSLNGRLCAFTTENKVVVLFGVAADTNCGAIVYADREAGELEFGPGAWLGVGIGLGDGNKVNLLEGGCHRTDPPPGRPRNRWMLQLGFDTDEIAGVHGPVDAAPSTPGPSADPRTQWGQDSSASTGNAPPTAGMLIYAVGLLGAASFLAYTALSDWYDDPFLAWMGVGILAISGVSILAASRKT